MDKHQRLYQQILDYAKSHDQVRVVEMNGSRVNDQIAPDPYQDFDIVFYVSHFKSFMALPSFVRQFGEILVTQTTDDQFNDSFKDDVESYVYLVQYMDGTRLDLTIKDVSSLTASLKEDSLSRILLDKDHHKIESNPDESSYYVLEPTIRDLNHAVNEFYWVSPYVGKGLARNHLFYAIEHLNIIRKELENMLDWWIGLQHDFKISVGKGKHRYQHLLPENYYLRYQKTYADVDKENIKSALFHAIELFDSLCLEMVHHYDFEYDESLKQKMISFINRQYIKK